MNWKEFLEQVSKTVIGSEDLLQEYNTNDNWLGFDPATDKQIREAEERLRIKLPPTYTDFLKTSNGFKQLSCFTWNILPVEQIKRLSEFDKDFADEYKDMHDTFNPPDDEYFVYGAEQQTTNFRSKYLSNCIALSGWGDASILLLNPEVMFGEECEAWMFAIWHLGPVRYKSFEELMVQEFSSYVELLNNKE
jgi:hypothetical protein